MQECVLPAIIQCASLVKGYKIFSQNMLKSVINVTNKGTIMTSLLRRMFSSRRRLKNSFAGIRNRLQLTEENESNDFEEHDAQDISEFEADFMNVGESHKMYESEMAINKERVKQQIVAKKYFKENDPRFLTFEEKERIRMLHESEPEQWPVERLSESFPALPETIQKILHSKWSPKSVESILRYDNTAIENWKKFHEGNLAVSPILYKHLMKFKDRKFVGTDRELLVKKFIPPKPTFKKPTKKLFSSIVQGHLNKQQDNTKLLSQKDDPSKIFDTSSSPNKHQNLLAASTMTDNTPAVARDVEQLVSNKKGNSISRLQSDSNKDHIVPYNENNNKYKNKNANKLFMYNEFLKAGLKDIPNMSPEESATLLDTYKDHVNAIEERQTTEVTAAFNNTVISAESNFAVSEYKDDDSDVTANDNLKDTCIKAWKKKIDTEGDYLKPIKITKNIYKPGMTYRISDCYYDDDGEFLYRVPGVQS